MLTDQRTPLYNLKKKSGTCDLKSIVDIGTLKNIEGHIYKYKYFGV